MRRDECCFVASSPWAWREREQFNPQMGDAPLGCCFCLGVCDAPAQRWELGHSFALSLSCSHVPGDLIQWHRPKNEKIQRKISDFFIFARSGRSGGAVGWVTTREGHEVFVWLGAQAWITFFSDFHFKMKSLMVMKSMPKRKGWEGIQCSMSRALEIALFSSRSPNTLTGKRLPSWEVGLEEGLE